MANLVSMGMQNKKIPQTDKLVSNSRKMSEVLDNRSQQQVYLDDVRNQLSEIQEPSDDHKSVGIGAQLARDLLEEEDFESSEVR